MPKIETWSRLPEAVKQHLLDRMRDRKISLDDLNQLRLWMDQNLRCRKAYGTKILVLSNYVERVVIPKHFCCLDKRQSAQNSDFM